MKVNKLAIIGGGNLGTAIAKGLLANGLLEASQIYITRRRTALLNEFLEKGVNVSNDNRLAASGADVILLGVKPYQLEQVVKEIGPELKAHTILISLATGISSESIQGFSSVKLPIFRAMPNTAIEIGESMTCVSAYNANQEQEDLVLKLFSQMGQALIIPEELMAASTVLAACGIAYAMRFIRAATQGGIEIGFGSKLALQISAQTIKGAADLLIQKGTHPEDEIDKVTTPRGVTISGLNEMEHQGFSSSLIKGLLTSFNKIENGK
ncbi:pyrroline-5-carboxylate reductase [Carboxylicivirga sediminis]|uniref:Pyrroline-5-carboxylate reductase n=1 Tax=Carboxylicivirga sediminis TaxID=2006564 RepID=A0A941F615_9BACT|nr:pyrroline-5-carboxylate reductase [Carboxylicivirga sediminis]MBR8536573.1 pyrroline-5-carboxylate reductase [Carboxylicivirga sediminis]